MACEHDKTELILWLYEEANEADRPELEARLSGCAECRQELEELRSGAGLVAALGSAEPSAAASGELRRELELVRLRQRPVFRPAAWLAPAALAACLLLGAAAGLMPVLQHPKVSAPEVPAQILAWGTSMDQDLEAIAADIERMRFREPDLDEGPDSELDRRLQRLSAQIFQVSEGSLGDPSL